MDIPFPGGLIRPWRPADAEALARLADDRELWMNLLDSFPHPYTRKDARAWIRAAGRQFPCRHFAISHTTGNGEPAVAGGIGIIPQDDVRSGTAEIGYWLGSPFRGRGIMTAALEAFSAFALSEFRLRRLHARVFAWNGASMRVLEKCGYMKEGVLRDSAIKDGRVVDEAIYARLARI